jgi:general stress protein 26
MARHAVLSIPLTEFSMNEAKLWDLIKDVKIAMLTTLDTREGRLRSRPLVTLEADREGGDLWFFTAADSEKVSEIESEWRVNLSYANPAREIYVSVSGVAELVVDRDRIRRLWSPVQLVWFPKGVDDPRLALLRVRIVMAEYWDGPATLAGKAISIAAGIAKAVVTRKSAEPMGAHEKVGGG